MQVDLALHPVGDALRILEAAEYGTVRAPGPAVVGGAPRPVGDVVERGARAMMATFGGPPPNWRLLAERKQRERAAAARQGQGVGEPAPHDDPARGDVPAANGPSDPGVGPGGPTPSSA